MKNEQKSRSNSFSKLNEEVDRLISDEKKNYEDNPDYTLKNILGEDYDLNNNQIPLDIDKKIQEYEEVRNFDLANSKKNKKKKIGLDFLNEQLDDLIRKTINDSKAETGGTESISKKSQNKKNRKKLIRHRKDFDDEYEDSLDINNNSITLNMNSDSNYDNYSNNDESSFACKDEKELMEFLNNKRCRKKNLEKYKEKYEKRNRYKNTIVLFDSDEEDSENIKENKDKKNIELNESDENKKHLKRLKKNTDNKEMKLALDTECIICTCIIKELANPDSCEHNFCRGCLIEWSQRSSKCPMCKKFYYNIFIYENGIKKQISINEIRNSYKKIVKDDSQNNDENDDEDDMDEDCYICGKNTDQGNLLVCDRCKEKCCHYYCINLNKIPEGNWYCQYCNEELKERKLNKKKVEHFFL